MALAYEDDTMTLEAARARVTALARDCFEKANGVRDTALDRLITRMDSDRPLKAAMAEYLLQEHYRHCIRLVASDQRVRIAARATSPEPYFGGQGANESHLNLASGWSPPKTEGAGIHAVIRNNETIFDWQLPGGKKIGDAMQSDVAGAMRFYASTEASAKSKKVMLEKVLAKLRENPGKKVKELYRPRDLEDLFAISGVPK